MSEIKPALTAEEWEDPNSIVWGEASAVFPWIAAADGTLSLECDDGHYHEELSAEQRLALGTMCLYGQPFGFTHTDVDELRLVARDAIPIAAAFCGTTESTLLAKDMAKKINSLAARIAALLPPEE